MAKKQNTPAVEGDVQARVLTDCEYGLPNDVVSLSPAAAQAGSAAGLLDTAAEAVAYAAATAESLAAD